MGGLGGARARHHPGRPAKRPEPRHALRAHKAPARHGPQRRPVPAERGALGPSGPEPQGVRARAARQPRAERHHPGAVRRVLLPGRDEGVDLQPAGHAGRGRPGGGGHRPGPAPRGPAGRLLPAVLRRRDPGVRLRTTAGQALRRPAARGADAAAGSGGALGLRRNHQWKQVAGARHHAPRDPIILRLAPSPDVLRGLPGPPAGQVRACDQGAARRGLHELERPRLLLQIRPHRREVRADRGPGPGQIPGREEGRRNAGVQGLAGVGGRGRQRPLLHRGPGAGPEGAPGRGALPQGGHAEHERVAVPAPDSARRPELRHLRLPRGPGGAAGLDGPAGAPLSRAAPGGRGERGLRARS